MSLKLLHLVIPMGVVCSSVIASATDSYIAQIATGLADGSSCANARGASYFNATTNWGAGATQIGPGTTVHLCGTISTQLTIQGSGSSASPLTVLWEPGAKISLPYCDNTNGCIKASGRSWVILNGNGTIPSIENTANGTALANHQDSVGVLANGPSCNSCEFKNLTISNLYVYVANSHDPHNFGVTGGFFLGGVSGSDFLKIHDNICHDVRACLSYNPTANDSGLQVYNNNFYNADGINIENNSASTPLIAATIHDNHFHDIANWDDAGCPYHHDGIHSWGLTGGTNAHIDFYNNLLDGNFGGCPTGAVFFEGIHTNTRFWNNVFATTFTQEQNGIVNIGSESLQFYNNTIIGANSSDICFVAPASVRSGQRRRRCTARRR